MQQRNSGPTPSNENERRFPFPSLPRGWFVVAMSQDVPADEVVPLRYFGQELVAFRGASGEVHVVDAYCPHLGANFAFGGSVEGDCIRCPFHGWRFDGQGRCVEVPYSERIPPKTKLQAYPVKEFDGVIFVYYSPVPGEAAADWELTTIAGEDWTPGKLIHWRGLRSHVQEVLENTVDTAHIAPVHDGRGARVMGEPVRDGARMVVDLEFEAPGEVVDMPNEFNDVHLHVTLNGLGDLVVRTHVRNVDVHAIQRIYVTPVDESTIDIRGIIHVRPTDDPEFTEELAEVFYRAYVVDFARDFPIWENKRYLSRPTLAKGDGPIGLYRRWCSQFYVAPGGAASVDGGGAEAGPEPGSGRLGGASLLEMIEPVRARAVETATQVVAQARARVPWLASLGGAREAGEAGETSDPGERAQWGEASGGRREPVAPKPKPKVTLPVTSVDDYVDTLPQRFVASAAAGVDAVYQWELAGEGGRTFHAIVRGGALEIVDGAHRSPTTTLIVPAADYVKVINGELDGTRVFTTGAGKVKGSIKAAMKMRALFPA